MKVEITPLREEHALTSYKWRNNPTVWLLTGGRPDRHITAEMELEWIKKAIANPDQKRYAILAEGVYVGNVQLTDLKDASAQFHIFIGDTSYWGKGVATAATKLMLETAFEKLGLKSVYLWVNKKNIAAQKVYEKCGFAPSGASESEIKMSVENKRQDA